MRLQEKLKNDKEEYYTHFASNLEKAKSILSKCTPQEYTFHGIKHSEMLEKFVFELMPEYMLEKLSADELFILLNGIYFHDIGMISYSASTVIGIDDEKANKALHHIEPNRGKHNVIARDMIFDEENNTFDPHLLSIPNGDPRYAKSISLLCYSHRDHKDENGIEVKTLEQVPVTEPFTSGNVHTLSLACLLRLADELDITNQRAPADIYFFMKNYLPEKSKDEWLQHELISMVEIDSRLHQIVLHPSLDLIKNRDKDNGDRTIVRNSIFRKTTKIESEINKINAIMESSMIERDYRFKYSVPEVKYDGEIVTKDDHEKFNELISKQKLHYKEEEVRSNKEEESVLLNESEHLNGEINDQYETHSDSNSQDKLRSLIVEFNEKIDLYKTQNQLLSLSKVKLPSNHYMRYHINTNMLLSEFSNIELITDILYYKYKSTIFDYAIGVGKAGMLIAPNLSFKLKCNYTYIVTGSDLELSTDFEKRPPILSNKKILLVTDVLATCSTILNLIDFMKSKLNIDSVDVAAVFSVNNLYKKEKEKTTGIPFFVVNESFQFDIFPENELESNESLKKEFDLLKHIE